MGKLGNASRFGEALARSWIEGNATWAFGGVLPAVFETRLERSMSFVFPMFCGTCDAEKDRGTTGGAGNPDEEISGCKAPVGNIEVALACSPLSIIVELDG
jgi:hypothetical protein